MLNSKQANSNYF